MPRERRSSFPTSRRDGSKRTRDIIAGRIYWLPAKDDHDITLLTPTSDDAGYFAHPVVVLWVDKQNNAQVFVVSEEVDEGVAVGSCSVQLNNDF